MASNARVRDEYEKNYEPWDGPHCTFSPLAQNYLWMSFVILANQLIFVIGVQKDPLGDLDTNHVYIKFLSLLHPSLQPVIRNQSGFFYKYKNKNHIYKRFFLLPVNLQLFPTHI